MDVPSLEQYGFDTKPIHQSLFPNKWCVRECERCVMSAPGEWMEPVELPDWSKRVRNVSQP